MPRFAPVPKFNALALKVLCITLACVGALVLYQVVLAQYTMTRFGEKWIVENPLLGTYVPLFAMALASGAVVGMLVGILGGTKALAISAWAGLCACVVMFVAAAAAGGIAWAITSIVLITTPLIAVGLVLGALAGRKLRHA